MNKQTAEFLKQARAWKRELKRNLQQNYDFADPSDIARFHSTYGYIHALTWVIDFFKKK